MWEPGSHTHTHTDATAVVSKDDLNYPLIGLFPPYVFLSLFHFCDKEAATSPPQKSMYMSGGPRGKISKNKSGGVIHRLAADQQERILHATTTMKCSVEQDRHTNVALVRGSKTTGLVVSADKCVADIVHCLVEIYMAL